MKHDTGPLGTLSRRAFCEGLAGTAILAATARAGGVETLPRGKPVLSPPRIEGPIPVTKNSVPYGTTLTPGSYTAALMERFDYVEEEYFLSGHANIYGPGRRGIDTSGGSAAVERILPLGGLAKPQMPYATRVLMVRPRDLDRFSGRVHAYTFHNLNAHVQVDLNLLRAGDAVLGLEGCSGTRFGPLETPSGGIAQLHRFDLDRYRDLYFSPASPLDWPDLTPGNLARAFENLDFGSGGPASGIFLQEISRSYAQAPDVIHQLARALKSRDPAFPFGDRVRHLFSFAASGGTTVLQPYIDLHHDAGILPDGRPPFDGYLVTVGRMPVTRPEGAVLVYLESESDLIASIRMGRDDPPDTDDPPFRIYQIPGAGHGLSASLPDEDARVAYQLGEKVDVVPEGIVGLSDRGDVPEGVLPYDKVNLPILWGVWHNMYAWIERGTPMPRAPGIERDPAAADGIARDEHGNARGGLRTPWVDVPDATYLPKISTKNPLRAGLRPFGAQKMNALYGSRENYLRLVDEKIDSLVAERWIQPEDADLMRLKS